MEAMKVILSIVERGQGIAMRRLYHKHQVPILSLTLCSLGS